MQFPCPNCKAKLTLGKPKPGRYKPKCKHCGNPFLIHVSEDDPPKVRVGKISAEKKGKSKSSSIAQPKSTSKPSTKSSSATTSPKKAVSASGSVASGSRGPATVSDMDASVDPALTGGANASVSSGSGASHGGTAASSVADETVDSSAGATSASDVNETMAPDASGGVSASVSQGTGSLGTGATQNPDETVASDSTHSPSATVEQTMDGASQAGEMSGAGLSGASVSAGSGASVSAGSGASESAGARSQSSAVVSAGRGSQSGSKPAARSGSSDEIGQIPQRLGGYKILKMLGRGAMGAVYQAQQISLDRNVALKTIRSRLAQNPASLARFTREAYAAAQLTHHNVVQIYDFGEDSGQHYFSMEWVRGGTLGELVTEQGPLDPKLAAGYVLQAARGLQFAHRNGMVHRDVKPANLLLNDEGVVKVADLGLVKIPDWVETEAEHEPGSVSGGQSGTHVTMQGTAVGTPAYMAPEQSTDATSVDHRADIYSLGCSLFYLLAGRAPFDGSVVSEVLEQHARKPVPNLQEINPRVPQSLIDIIGRCMAKQPVQRYESLAQMIDDLEAFMGVSKEGDFSGTTEQADRWEAIVKDYNKSQLVKKLAKPAFLIFTLVCLLLTAVMPFVSLSWAAIGLSTWFVAVGTALILAAPGGKNPMVVSIRRWIGTLGWLDYTLAIFAVIVVLAVGFVAGLTMGALVGAILGGILGAAYHFGLMVPASRSGRPVVMHAEKFIRDLRIQGADEEGLRNFLARYAGKKWEPIYETLFGYSALGEAKQRLTGDPSFQAPISKPVLRDRVCEKFNSKADSRIEARDHEKLAKIEQRGLVSEGLSPAEARERSWQMASAVMDGARAPTAMIDDAEAAAQAKRARIKADLEEARSGKYKKKRDALAPVKLAFSGYMRFHVGCLLLAAIANWAQSTGLIDAIRSGEKSLWEVLVGAGTEKNEYGLNPFSLGAAGILMIFSAFVSGWRMTPFAFVATIVIVFGTSFGIPNVAIIPAWLIALAAGIVIYIPGVLFGESGESE